MLVGHRGTIHAVSFPPDGKMLASVDTDATVLLWDTKALTPERSGASTASKSWI
jgi:WD40 repeat protein